VVGSFTGDGNGHPTPRHYADLMRVRTSAKPYSPCSNNAQAHPVASPTLLGIPRGLLLLHLLLSNWG
jgi:hypothetical protein